MSITFTSEINDICVEMLDGFFVGWAKPLTPEQHFNHLTRCAHFIAAIDNGKVVGFISALTDGIGCAFIPLLEVLPEYQKRGIGSKLMQLMLEKLSDINAIDLMCDDSMQEFYERFGMKKLNGMGLRR